MEVTRNKNRAAKSRTIESPIAERRKPTFPWHGWLGAALVLVAWPLNWILPGTRTAWLFFPLWLGYALTMDGLVYLRKGSSAATRSWRAYVGLFLISAPVWWLFEAFNLRTQNWSYQGVSSFSPLAYFLLASLNFSTVIPAVFGAAELASTFGWVRRLPRWLVVRDDRRTTLAFFITGWVMLALLLLFPEYCFPFVWLSVYFITEPINVWLGHRSLGERTRSGDWRVVVSLFIGVLITAFFWEMWNFYAFPKWIYRVPFVGFAKIFEMPALGYGGYLPFALELYAVYHMVMGLLGKRKTEYMEFKF